MAIRIAASVFLVFLACPAWAQTITVQTPAVATGGTITVMITGSPGYRGDWVGLVPATADDSAYQRWSYLNGLKTYPAAGVSSASVSFIAPSAPGTYTIRLFLNDTLTKLATSLPVTVGGASTALPTVGKIVFNGDSISSADYMPGSNNWTAKAAAQLGYSTAVNLASAGKHASGVLNELPAMLAAGAQMCVVLVGGNDMATAVYYDVPAEQARTEYLAIMRQIVTGLKSGGCPRIAILTPSLPMQAREVLRYEAWVSGLRELCAEFGVVFLDLFHHMADLSAVKSSAIVNGWYAAPGVDMYHLSAAGHAMLAAFVIRSGKLTP